MNIRHFRMLSNTVSVQLDNRAIEPVHAWRVAVNQGIASHTSSCDAILFRSKKL
jgi:hypothetical protein